MHQAGRLSFIVGRKSAKEARLSVNVGKKGAWRTIIVGRKEASLTINVGSKETWLSINVGRKGYYYLLMHQTR